MVRSIASVFVASLLALTACGGATERESLPAQSPTSVIPADETAQTTALTLPETAPQLSNDNYYKNSSGVAVHAPAFSSTEAPPPGATAVCADGTYSFSMSRQGTCSHHGGVAGWNPGGAVTVPAAMATTTTRPCPTGRPVATVSTFTVTPNPMGGPGSGIWDVVVGGTVTNNTSGSITLAGLDVVVKDSTGEILEKTHGFTQASEIPRHGATPWGLMLDRPLTIFGQATDAPLPARAEATLDLWFWNGDFIRCQTR